MDFPQSLGANQVVITPYSLDSISIDLRAWGTAVAVAAWPTANKALYYPFLVHRPLLVKVMAWFVGTASGNADCGIYDDQQNKIVSAGATAVAGSSALQTVDITDTTLLPGTYYAGMSCDNTTATFRRVIGVNFFTFAACGVLRQLTAYPLPSPAVFSNHQGTDNYIPDLMILGRTVV